MFRKMYQNQLCNADETAVIIRSPQRTTVYLSSTNRRDRHHLAAHQRLTSKRGVEKAVTWRTQILTRKRWLKMNQGRHLGSNTSFRR